MKRSVYKLKSKSLGQEANLIVYGEGGYPVVAFQTQDQKASELEDEGMVDALAEFIDGKQIQLFADGEPWNITTLKKKPASLDCQPRGGFVMIIK